MTFFALVQEQLGQGLLYIPLGGAIGAALLKLLATERPYVRTIRHQGSQIERLQSEHEQLRLYVRELVGLMRENGIEPPLPPSEVF